MKIIHLIIFSLLVQLSQAQDISSFPYFSGFEGLEGNLVENYPEGWSSEDLNVNTTGNQGWQIIKNSAFSDNARTDSTAVHMFSHSSETNNDWLFTPSIEMVQGVTYTLEFWYKVNLFGGTSESLEIIVGTENTAAAMTGLSPSWTQTGIISESYQQALVTYVAPNDGVFYFSFHYFSPSFSYLLMIDDVTVDSGVSSTFPELTAEPAYNFRSSPFTGALTFSLSEPLLSVATLRISDSLGRTVHSETLQPGAQEWFWLSSKLMAGNYFIQLKKHDGELILSEQFLR